MGTVRLLNRLFSRGALSARLPWIFGSNSILLGLRALAAYLTIPKLRPAKGNTTTDAPSLRQFDYFGALLASLGCGLVLFGLTQGSSVEWNPYTYSTVILGFLSLVGFYFIERGVARPLIPNGLWRTPGFISLLVAYYFGLGAYGKFLISGYERNPELNQSHLSRRRMALLRRSILAALSRSHSAHSGTLPPPQWHRRYSSRLGKRGHNELITNAETIMPR